MAGQTSRGYPLFDPTGADQNIRGAEYFNSLTGFSGSSLVNRLDDEQEAQDTKLSQHEAQITQLKSDIDTTDEALETIADGLTNHVADAERHITEEERITWNQNDGKTQVYIGETEPEEPNVQVWINPVGAASLLQAASIGYTNETTPDVTNAKQGIDAAILTALAAIPSAQKGQADGVGTLDADGKQPDAQLASAATRSVNNKSGPAITLNDTDIPYTGGVVPGAEDLREAVDAAHGLATAASSAATAAQVTANAASAAAVNAQATADTKTRTTFLSAVLYASAWVDGEQTITNADIPAPDDTGGDVYVPLTGTDEQHQAWAAATPRVAAQQAGSITLRALGTAPTIDIPIEMEVRI